MSVNVDMCVRVRVSVVGGRSARQSGRSAGAAPKVRTPHNDVGNYTEAFLFNLYTPETLLVDRVLIGLPR